jgi:hypothetical protein
MLGCRNPAAREASCRKRVSKAGSDPYLCFKDFDSKGHYRRPAGRDTPKRTLPDLEFGELVAAELGSGGGCVGLHAGVAGEVARGYFVMLLTNSTHDTGPRYTARGYTRNGL